MADLGILNTDGGSTSTQGVPVSYVAVSEDQAKSRLIPVWEINPLGADIQGTIRGTVTVNLLPLKGAKVELFDRKSFQLIAVTLSGADGSYEFVNLNRQSSAYSVIATTDLPYNAVVRDKLTPV
jgi:hypothetical protein